MFTQSLYNSVLVLYISDYYIKQNNIILLFYYGCFIGIKSASLPITAFTLIQRVIIPAKTKTKQMEAEKEIQKAEAHVIVEIIEYIPNAVLSKTIVKKLTGNITVSSYDAGEETAEKTSPFDNYVQIIDGTAEVTIKDKVFKLKLGHGIIIPAHSSHCFNANEKFKMICTIIKSGYEE